MQRSGKDFSRMKIVIGLAIWVVFGFAFAVLFGGVARFGKGDEDDLTEEYDYWTSHKNR